MQTMNKFLDLVLRFQNLSVKFGTSKSSSYQVSLTIGQDKKWCLNLGCYDIEDWPRNLLLGPFLNIEEVLEAFETKVKEAEAIPDNFV
jgi:hypothetical protein